MKVLIIHRNLLFMLCILMRMILFGPVVEAIVSSLVKVIRCSLAEILDRLILIKGVLLLVLGMELLLLLMVALRIK